MQAWNDLAEMIDERLGHFWRDNHSPVGKLEHDRIAKIGSKKPIPAQAAAVEPPGEGEKAAIAEHPYRSLADSGVCPEMREPHERNPSGCKESLH